MRETPPEIAIAAMSFMAFWLLAVVAILVVGRSRPAVREFRDRMVARWKPALVIASLFLLGVGIDGRGFLNPYAIAVFCQALIGLTIATSIEGFQPLPVVNAIAERRQVVRQVALMAVISVLVVIPAQLIGTVGLDVGRQLFGEPEVTRAGASTLPPNKWLAFFPLLGGSGIAEETPYRLVLLSLIWKATRRKWLAIIVSALVFGAYHLTPLSGMYQLFWQFPISQFMASTLVGLVWGYLFTRRGYETTVLAHAFSNWIPLMLFSG